MSRQDATGLAHSELCHIAIDVMGGDHGPQITVPAALQALKKNPHLKLTLLGNAGQIRSLCSSQVFAERLSVIDCPDVVAMDEKPSSALRSKKQSSMYKAVELVSQGQAHACVSAGNTGALMAIGRYLLKTFPGIDRPAICSEMPTENGTCLLLDLGANVDSHSDHLHQFAVMGSVMSAALNNIAAPKVGLLNIGEEEIKGNEQVKLAASLLEKNPNLNYIGYVEGDDIYKGTADVVVCDGFVGNVVLKASEGVARLIVEKIRQTWKRNMITRILAFLSRVLLDDLRRNIDPSGYNGASFLGLQGTVVVSHGSAGQNAFGRAIQLACSEVEQDLPRKINQQLETLGY